MDRFSVVLVVLLCGFQAGAAPLVCATNERATRYTQELNILYDSFAGPKLCEETEKLFSDLALIEDGEFAGVASHSYIQNLVAADDYYPWLVSQTRVVERAHDLPWSVLANSWGSFTIQDGWGKLSTVARVGSLLHEARHTEGFSHTSCAQGPYRDSGVAGCDENATAGGAHAVEMEYYARVAADGSNFHPVYQSMARMMLQARSNTVFNESPPQAEDVLLARTSEGTIRIQGDSRTFIEGGEAPLMVKELDSGLRRYQFALDGGKIVATVVGQEGWSSEQPWPGIVQLATTDALGRSGLFALFNDQTYCPVQIPRIKCEREPAAWPADAKQFVKFSGQLLRLGFDGHVYDSKGDLWPALEGLEVLEMTVN